MKYLIVILFFCITPFTYGGTCATDTIDYWHIYNGKQLIIAGNGTSGLHLKSSIRKNDLHDLVITFFSDAPNSGSVVIDLIDEGGEVVLTRQFNSNSRGEFLIGKNEMQQLKSKRITIRYKEKAQEGRNMVLGQIHFL